MAEGIRQSIEGGRSARRDPLLLEGIGWNDFSEPGARAGGSGGAPWDGTRL